MHDLKYPELWDLWYSSTLSFGNYGTVVHEGHAGLVVSAVGLRLVQIQAVLERLVGGSQQVNSGSETSSLLGYVHHCNSFRWVTV